MLIYICDDSRADQLRLVHNIESYAKEKGASVTVKLFSSADALLREYETSTEKPAVIFLDIYMDGTNGMDAALAEVVPRTILSSIRTTRLPLTVSEIAFSLILTEFSRIPWVG